MCVFVINATGPNEVFLKIYPEVRDDEESEPVVLNINYAHIFLAVNTTDDPNIEGRLPFVGN